MSLRTMKGAITYCEASLTSTQINAIDNVIVIFKKLKKIRRRDYKDNCAQFQ